MFLDDNQEVDEHAAVSDSEIRNQPVQPVECTKCKQIFKTPLSHTRHLNACKSINNICQICDEIFDEVVELRTHVYEDHSGKLYSCNLETCPLSFTTKKGQEYHINNAHKSYACTQCKQVFP